MRYRSVGGFALGTLFSRILGLVREGVIAYLLGASKFSDALYVAFRIPNLLRDVLAEGSIQTAFVPTYLRARAQNRSPKDFLRAIVLLLISITTLLVIVGIIFAPLLVSIFAFGFTKDPDKFKLTVHLTRITFPFLFAVAVSALISGVLNSFRKFFVPALSPVFFNLGVIGLGIIALIFHNGPRGSSYLLAVGIVTGGALQAIFQFPFLKSISRKDQLMGKKTPSFQDLHHPYVKPFLKLILPVALSTALTRFSLFVNTLIASFMKHGAISYLNYAYRVMHLPLGLFGVGIATVILPELSSHISKGKDLISELRKGIEFGLFLTIPVSILFAFDSFPIISILFKRGSFDNFAVLSTSQALLFYSLGIPFFTVSRVLLNFYYTQHRIKIPNLVFLSGSIANLAIAVTLSPYMGFKALALATSFAGITQSTLLYIFIERETGQHLLGGRFLVKEFTLIVTLAAGFTASRSFFHEHIILRLLFDLSLGAVVYLAFSYMLRVKIIRRPR